jgi:peptidyl-prolyl cis-trans isomerase C
MMKLKKGEWTKKPVKTKFGYHIILLEDVRPVQFPPLDQVKDRISQQMLAQKRDKEIEALRAGAKIELPSSPSATDKPAQ